MLSAIAIIPSAPVLVPELASGAAVELADLTAAVRSAAQVLPSRWVAIGVGSQDSRVATDAVGTFAGYGLDIRVTFASDTTGEVQPLPLCALIAGWLRGSANPDATVDVRVFAEDLAPDPALERGRALRTELDAAADAVGVLVIADGANTLTAAAPGGFDPDSVARQAQWDDALAEGELVAVHADGAVFRQGDAGAWVYTVRSGIVRFERSTAAGDRRIVRLAGRSSLVGMEAMLGQTYAADAIACTPVRACSAVMVSPKASKTASARRIRVGSPGEMRAALSGSMAHNSACSASVPSDSMRAAMARLTSSGRSGISASPCVRARKYKPVPPTTITRLPCSCSARSASTASRNQRPTD